MEENSDNDVEMQQIRESIENWTLEALLGRIERDQSLTIGDFAHPDILKHQKLVGNMCDKYPDNKSSKKMKEILVERQVLHEIEEINHCALQITTEEHIDQKDSKTHYTLYNLSVRSMNLNDIGLKYLPKDFGLLKNLKHLDVYGNHLKFLPYSFREIKHIWLLNLNANEFEEIPIGISRLENNALFMIQILNKVPQSEWDLYIECDQNYVAFHSYKMQQWTLEGFYERIRLNQSPNQLDFIHPTLEENKQAIEEFCATYPTETAKQILEYLHF